MNQGTKNALMSDLFKQYKNGCELHVRKHISAIDLASTKDKSMPFKFYDEQSRNEIGHVAAAKATMFASFPNGEDLQPAFSEHILYAFGYGEFHKFISELFDKAYERGVEETIDLLQKGAPCP